MDVNEYAFLKWPEDVSTLRRLRLDELMCWYACQDPKELIFLAQKPEFKRFMLLHYIWPLKIKRFMYKIKHVLENPFA